MAGAPKWSWDMADFFILRISSEMLTEIGKKLIWILEKIKPWLVLKNAEMPEAKMPNARCQNYSTFYHCYRTWLLSSEWRETQNFWFHYDVANWNWG